MKRSIDIKMQARDKRKAYTQQRSSYGAAASNAPKDVRTELLASRGAKGKEVANKATERQKRTPCRHFFGPTGVCSFGTKCKFAHVGLCRLSRCKDNTITHQANEPVTTATKANTYTTPK